MASKQEKFKKQLMYGDKYCAVHDKMKLTFSGKSAPACLQCILDENRRRSEQRTISEEEKERALRMAFPEFRKFIELRLGKRN